MSGWRRIEALAVVAACLPAFPMPAAAAIAPEPAAISAFSERGDFIGQGRSSVFDSRHEQITVEGDTKALTISAGSGDWSVRVSAGQGDRLRKGRYDRADGDAYRDSPGPGLDVSGSGRGCNTSIGRFEIKKISTTADGTVKALWLSYRQHCEGNLQAAFGEVRFGLGQDGPLLTTRSVSWPDTYPGAGGATVRVLAVNTSGGPVTLGKPVAGGQQRADFRVRGGGCSGRTLQPGERCTVAVRFKPRARGSRRARLAIPARGRSTSTVALGGRGTSGLTRVSLASERGDYVGQGKRYGYTPANAAIGVSGTREHVSVGIAVRGGGFWSADFAAPPGEKLKVGRRYSARRYPFNEPHAGLSFDGMGRGCNSLEGSFVIRALHLGGLPSERRLKVSFVQHCDGASPALRGTIAFRAPG